MKTWKRTKRRYAGAIRSAWVRQYFERYWSHLADLTKTRVEGRRGQPSPWNALIPPNTPPGLGPTVSNLTFDTATLTPVTDEH